MDIKTALLQEHSKAQMQRIAIYIGTDTNRFGELINLLLGSEYRVTQRAAWVLSACADNHPELLTLHIKNLILNLERTAVPDAVKRNTVRVLQSVSIPEELQGTLATICFDYLAGQEPIAVKVFAMTVLANLAQQEPDLKNELRLIIEDQLPYASPAFLSRSRKVLKQLKQK